MSILSVVYVGRHVTLCAEAADSCALNAVCFLTQSEVAAVNSIGQLKIWDVRQPSDKPVHVFIPWVVKYCVHLKDPQAQCASCPSVCLSAELLRRLSANFHQIYWRAWYWYKEWSVMFTVVTRTVVTRWRMLVIFISCVWSAIFPRTVCHSCLSTCNCQRVYSLQSIDVHLLMLSYRCSDDNVAIILLKATQ